MLALSDGLSLQRSLMRSTELKEEDKMMKSSGEGVQCHSDVTVCLSEED